MVKEVDPVTSKLSFPGLESRCEQPLFGMMVVMMIVMMVIVTI